MKFLLDVCASSRSMHRLLIELGHDVVSARDGLSHATDEALLTLAYEDRRVLITEDKDFGELVFVRRLPHPCIIRFVAMSTVEKLDAMREIIEYHANAMREDALIVVTREQIRFRPGRHDN